MAKPVLTKAFLQPVKTAAMCMSGLCLPTSPIPPFLLAQNLSSKRIAPTDNMWSKLQAIVKANITTRFVLVIVTRDYHKYHYLEVKFSF